MEKMNAPFWFFFPALEAASYYEGFLFDERKEFHKFVY